MTIAFGNRCWDKFGKQGDVGFVKGKNGLKPIFVALDKNDQMLLKEVSKKGGSGFLWGQIDLNFKDIVERGFFVPYLIRRNKPTNRTKCPRRF
ncbi:hypothetical protein AB834_06315 [PVC group bacterium (ex Bugula neritina AB1)]|nr:hypothetical protein AB834_06315 [PVC group bacterium (ex Bugula neritina AB1)]